jgi:iron(III) transport system ATP-binding protein
MTDHAIVCQNLSKSFGSTPAVKDVSLRVRDGECMALLGPSGCGKTTLLRLIAGFEAPDSGSLTIGDRVVAGDRVYVPPERRRVGIVLQDYALFPHLTVSANIAFGLPKRAERAQRVEEMLGLVDLEGYGPRMPHELSGGEQQRVALARALAPAPQVLLLDEPFSSLDADLRARTRADVKRILARAGATVVLVTHDQQEALYMGDRVAVMQAGQIEQVDTPWAIYHRPETPFVARFVGVAELFPGTVHNGRVLTEVGELGLGAERLAHGEQVRVLLRPHCVGLRPRPDGVGVIIERVFQGSHYLYRVQLPSGGVITSLQPCTCEYAIHTRVDIVPMRDQEIVCFAQGQEHPCGLSTPEADCFTIEPVHEV